LIGCWFGEDSWKEEWTSGRVEWKYFGIWVDKVVKTKFGDVGCLIFIVGIIDSAVTSLVCFTMLKVRTDELCLKSLVLTAKSLTSRL